MKIAVATIKGGLDDVVSPVLARCETFTLVEVEDKQIQGSEIIENTHREGTSGVGVQVGQMLINMKVNAVIAGNFGPNVFEMLKQAGIEMIRAEGSVRESIMKYLNGELKPIDRGEASGRFGGPSDTQTDSNVYNRGARGLNRGGQGPGWRGGGRRAGRRWGR